jgi:integrase
MQYKYSKYITVEPSTSTSKRKRKWFYGNSIKELENNIDAYLEQHRKYSGPSIIFGAFAEKWLDTYKSKKSVNTREMYTEALKKCSALNDMQVRDITRSDCQNVINGVWDMPRTAQIVRLTLKQIFSAAVDDGIIESSPAARLDLPKQKRNEKRLLSEAELNAVRKADLKPMDRMFVNLMLTFGLRPGEALALTKKDFDLEAKILHINKAVEMPNSSVSRIKGTKTDATRDIPIPEAFKTVLDEYIPPKSVTLLIHKEDGSLSNKSSYRRLCERIIKAISNELGYEPEGLTMYSFRHYRATQLYYLTQQGKISTKKAAYLMGHSEKVFLDVYSHIDDDKEDLGSLYSNLML